jgi:hypothetical protein
MTGAAIGYRNQLHGSAQLRQLLHQTAEAQQFIIGVGRDNDRTRANRDQYFGANNRELRQTSGLVPRFQRSALTYNQIFAHRTHILVG